MTDTRYLISTLISDLEVRCDTQAILAIDMAPYFLYCRDVLNGEETLLIEEDGVVTVKTHNGRPCITSV